MRRSFRLGLRFGVLVGALFAVYKIAQSRRTPDAAVPPVGGGWAGGDSAWTPPPPPGRRTDPGSAPAVTPPPALKTEPPSAGTRDELDAAAAAVAGVDPGLEAEISELSPTGEATATPAAGPAPVPPPPLSAPPAPAPATVPTAPPAAPTARVPAARKAAGAAKASNPGRTAKTAKAKTAKAKKPLPAEVWVEPTGSTCPSSHPVKAKLSSRIFHLPGMFAYDRTRPDRCYSGADTALADGFTQAKR